jgi:ABC-type spermidine/putrescine transport system permease subunit II
MIVGFATVLTMIFAGEWLVVRMAAMVGGAFKRAFGSMKLRMPDLPLCETVAGLALVFLFAPLITVVVFSFNDTPNPGLPFAGVTGKWYVEIVQREDFLRVLRTSLLVCVSSVLGALIIGVPAAIALARRQFPLKFPLEMPVYGPMAVLGVVLGVALLATFVTIGIRLGVATTILAHILLLVPFIVLVVRTRLEKIDPRVEEAGRDLGSRPSRVFRTVTLPMLTPSLLGAGLLAAAISLDDLLVTNFTIGANATVPVWIASQMRVGLTPALNAVSVLMLIGSLGLIALAAIVVSFRRSMRLSTMLAER